VEDTAGNGNDEARAYTGYIVISRDAFKYNYKDHLDNTAADVDLTLDDPTPGVNIILSSIYTTGNCPNFWPSIRITPLLRLRGSLFPRTL